MRLPVYPARELPMEGVTSDLLLDKMNLAHKRVIGKTALLEWMEEHQPKLVVMAGAGDIDAMVQKVKIILDK